MATDHDGDQVKDDFFPDAGATTHVMPIVRDVQPGTTTQHPLIGTAHCGNNDVHLMHGVCSGVSVDGTGLLITDGYPDPWPQHPGAFLPSALESYYDARERDRIRIREEQDASQHNLFGVYDDEARALIDFRVRNGKLEAKYFASDLDEAAQRFMDHLMKTAREQGYA